MRTPTSHEEKTSEIIIDFGSLPSSHTFPWPSCRLSPWLCVDVYVQEPNVKGGGRCVRMVTGGEEDKATFIGMLR